MCFIISHTLSLAILPYIILNFKFISALFFFESSLISIYEMKIDLSCFFSFYRATLSRAIFQLAVLLLFVNYTP